MSWLISGVLLIIAYLIGSLATGYWLAKAIKGIDIREVGSGSTGATNILRTLGAPAALFVLLIDVCKGALAADLVHLLPDNISTQIPEQWQPWLIAGTAVAAIVGHSRSIFLNFTGGKSVATSLGAFLLMTPQVGLIALGTFLLVLAIFRMVSLGSITAALSLVVFMFILREPLPYTLLGIFASTYVIIRHRANMQRILTGLEPKIGQKPQENS
jgi:glycerol-3-phosphate acyltransferase PlsY